MDSGVWLAGRLTLGAHVLLMRPSTAVSLCVACCFSYYSLVVSMLLVIRPGSVLLQCGVLLPTACCPRMLMQACRLLLLLPLQLL